MTKPPLQETKETLSLVEILRKTKENCKNCHPITPLTCITECNIWKAKREFRKLYKIIRKPNYLQDLLNTLKNKRRLQILEIISNKKSSLLQIQHKLKKLGYYHSQKTIIEEYITPLINTGLAEEDSKRYRATVFGCKLNKLTKEFQEIAELLPARSECCEEETLSMLLNGPKTYVDLKQIIPAKSVARILNRLQKVGLIKTPKEKEYIFYFKTKRDQSKVELSPTERRVYENIPFKGVSARKLAERIGISLRRTYKYLKKLKRKKLVFTRKRLKSYALTEKGFQVANTLKEINKLAVEALVASALLVKDKEIKKLLMPTISRRRKKKGPVLLTILPDIKKA